jgi:5'(3')-deoxyribonucleotidase
MVMTIPNIAIYLDMDGVLVDFDKRAEEIYPPFQKMSDYFHRGIGSKTEYNKLYTNLVFKIMRTKNFWIDLPRMHDGKKLYDYVKTHFHTEQTGILTAPMNQDLRCEPEKIEWVERNLHTIKPSHIFVDLNKEKFVGKIPGKLQILVDDRLKNIEAWREAGGIGIHHKSAAE